MIIEANSIPRDSKLTADILIVGSGAAGIPMALSLAGRGLSVILFEAGFPFDDKRTQALYEGEVAEER
jgi:choline dehydrogenase-like flavoprotein